MPGSDDRYYGNALQPQGSRNADGRCGRSKKRAAEVDSLFPRRDEHSFPRQPEWIRSVPCGRPRRGMDSTTPATFPDSCSHLTCHTESDAGCDDHLGFNMPFTMVQVDIDCELDHPLLPDDLHSHDNPQILFLNKNDLFEKKVQHSPIKNFFPVSHVQPFYCKYNRK